MRLISRAECKQRGCIYCMHVKSSSGVSRRDKDKEKYVSKACPYAKCPYTVMDEYKTYDEYCATLSERYADMLELFGRVSA